MEPLVFIDKIRLWLYFTFWRERVAVFDNLRLTSQVGASCRRVDRFISTMVSGSLIEYSVTVISFLFS